MVVVERLFGTDGIRGRAGEGWLSADAVSALGRAIGMELDGRARTRRAVLAHDGRRSGPELEAAVARGLASCGFQSTSAGVITTPGLAFLSMRPEFDLGVMVSASHNPAEDNGIKLFGGSGEKLDDRLEERIEARLRSRPEPVRSEAPESPRPELDPGLEEAYFAHLLGKGAGLELSGLCIALDCANGGGSRIAPRVFGRLGAQVLETACAPDGDNINLGCGSTDPEALCAAVRLQGADLGVALDGDGDRCVLVDERGTLVHGDALLAILALDARERGQLPEPRIVATVMSNRGLHRTLRERGIEVVTVGVGDRRVVEEMKRAGLALGGEQSGHVVFAEDGYIGDGTCTALRALRALKASGKRLSALAAGFRPFPQRLVNVSVDRKPDLAGIPGVAAKVAEVEAELGQDGRVLLRYSGTEQLARVMVEGPDELRVEHLARDLAAVIAREIGGS